MTDPIADIIGDYNAFAAQQRDRLLARGIDIAPYALSHLAFRVPEWDQYVHVRTQLERHAVANRENVWNGRPISLIVPAERLEVLDYGNRPEPAAALTAPPEKFALTVTSLHADSGDHPHAVTPAVSLREQSVSTAPR